MKSAGKINIITMGCSKNLVDSERILRMLGDAGFNALHNADSFSSGTVVVNTCGFIGDAKEESIDMILAAVEQKKQGAIDAVYVMGCLSERYRKELQDEIPEVDGWYGKFDWPSLVAELSIKQPDYAGWARTLTTPSHHAYLKIAEGCNRFCAFCAIPLITGRYKSRPVDEIVREVEYLVAKGVKEFNVIAQDLSSYGHDLPGNQSRLAELLDRIADIPGVEWIRLHYAYPSDFPYDILPVMARRPNICKYLDIALQHIDDTVLTNMRRHISAKQTRELLDRIRREVPGIHIRTTLMTGFPGETPEAFERLKDFVTEQKFERMGAFAYCEEDDTWAAKNLTDTIPDEVKQERLDELMDLQAGIALESNRQKVGQRLRVIVDSENEDFYVGRTEFDSPEVDPEVLIEKDKELTPGQFTMVEITGADTYELYAKPL